MDTYDSVNELVLILQKWRDLENSTMGLNLPPVEPLDVMTMVNYEPDTLQNVLNVARENPDRLGLTEALPDEITENYANEIRNEWRFIPTDYHVRDADYNSLVKYFRNERGYSQLNGRQRTLLKYMTYDADVFSVDAGMGF